MGALDFVSLAEAREQAAVLLKQVKSGLDPLAERKRKESVPTFEEACTIVWQQNRPTWKSEKHALQWLKALEDHAYPVLKTKRISEISSANILDVLSPIWTNKTATAKRVRQRMRAVFDWAKASGYYSGDNPVDGVKMALPKQSNTRKHHNALPWQQLPEFMCELNGRSGLSAKALAFLILTAGRSGEIRGAVWSEMKGDRWVIPAARMKMTRDHRVPLSSPALEIVRSMRGLSETLVFPSSQNSSKQMSNMVFKALFVRMGHDQITAHGFRSTFRDWVADNDIAAREVAEASLAHLVGGETERAYARSDMFDRRRVLMEKWAEFALSG